MPTVPLPGLERFDDGDVLLRCESAELIRVHGQLLSTASPVFKAALACSAQGAIEVSGDVDTWAAVLSRLYPLHPRPKLELQTIYDALPVVHKYNIESVQSELLDFLSTRFPADLSSDPESPCSIVRWLGLADSLQLDGLRNTCMRKIRDMAYNKQLEPAIIAGKPNANRLPRSCSQPKPAACPCGTHGSAQCVAWCSTHKWTCKSYYGSRAMCGCSSSSLHPSNAPWGQSESPPLADGIKQLSKGTLEELLGSMVVIAVGNYSNS